MKIIISTSALLSMVALCSCSGGGDNISLEKPSNASALSYQDPEPSGFRLVKNAGASSGTHLVLNLVGPSGTQGKGVAFFLDTDAAKVTWVHPTGVSGTRVAAGNVFPLGDSPRMMKDKVEGGQLQVGLFQKGGTATLLGDAPILSLAMDLKGTTVPKGVVTFAPSGKQAVLLNALGSLTPITIKVGTLNAQ